MWLFQPMVTWACVILLWGSALPLSLASTGHVIGTRSLKPCMVDSGITATYVDISFHTNTSTLHFDINAYSTITGNVKVLMTVYAYGFKAFTQDFDPCKLQDWTQLCPMSPQAIQLSSNQDLGSDLVSQVPAAAYNVPDLDAYVRLQIVSVDGNDTLLACVDAQLSNGVTVERGVVSWTTAFVAGGALLWAIFVISCSNPSLHSYYLTTAKFAAYSFTFYIFIQSQAMIGMTSVPLPPIVSAWTQNLVWAVGIVEMDFLQRFFHWYIRSTGGHRSSLFNQLSTTSVLVMKRDLSATEGLRSLTNHVLRRRADILETAEEDPKDYQPIMVKGIERVAFKAGIEQTNLFITSYSMYIIFTFVVVVLFLSFTAIVRLLAKKKVFGMGLRFITFREHWVTMLRRVALCLVIIGYPALIALPLWELTMRDSPAVVVLAVVIFLAVTLLMAAAVFKLYMILRQTGVMPFSTKGPLSRFSSKGPDAEKPVSEAWRDSTVGLTESKARASRDLKQFSILTVPYRRSGVYWVLPLMLFIFTKSALVGLSQQHLYNAPSEDESSVGTVKGIAQAIGFLIIDLLWLIGVAWVRPWMDKPTNTLGIACAVLGLLNGIFLLIFTEAIPGQAKPAKPIVGVLFVLFNIIMSLVFFVVTIVSAVYALMDWKKGHPNSTGTASIGGPVPSSISPDDYANHNMTSTPDPFLPTSHGNETLPLELDGERTARHMFSVDGRPSTSTLDSRDITALQPTEPKMSMTSFNTDGQDTGVAATASDYPLQVITTRSYQAPPGVAISEGEDARIRDGGRLPPNQQPFAHTFFGTQDSSMSQRGVNSIHSNYRPGPGLYMQGSGNYSQGSLNRTNLPPITQDTGSGMRF